MKHSRVIIRLLLLAACGATMLLSGIYLYLLPELRSDAVFEDVQPEIPMRVYTREGALIGQFGEKKRNPLPYDEIPEQFRQALLAAEDDDFFDHVGIDIMGLARAVFELVLTGEKGSGGSTLTMQLARNYFLSQERTFTRKFKEILLSLEIERVWNKQEIFERYFNLVFLGHRAYGFEAAAQVYYGAHIDELNLSQLAMLAGLPKAPSRYNPISNPERSLIRRNWILGRMQSLGFIDEAAYQQALVEPINASHHGAKLAFDAPYAAEMARSEIIRKCGLEAYTEGYHIYTTINAELQRAANAAIDSGLEEYDQRHGYRGPELQLPPTPDADMQALWLQQLGQTGSVGDRQGAIVTRVGQQAVEILLGDGSRAVLDWDSGLSEARAYIDENRRGPRPKTAAEILQAGDLIRVRSSGDGDWRLTQVPQAQAALVSLAADDGALLSVVGGLGFSRSKFNRVTQAARQPGSNFKPFIYAAALEQGFTAASIINDAPVVIEEDAALEKDWRPENDGGKFYGPTRLRWALTKSRNLVSIRLLRELDIEQAIDYMGRFGFDTDKLPEDLSLALGTHAITPLQVVAAYARLANGGYRAGEGRAGEGSVEPYLIARVEDFDRREVFRARPFTVCRHCEEEPEVAADPEQELSMEEILEQVARMALSEEQRQEDAGGCFKDPIGGKPLPPEQAERIMDARTAFIIDSILQDVITRGTGRPARALERSDIAGKTGTTNGPKDAWFSGYNADVVTTVWVGFDDPELLLGKREFGGSAALPIWIEYMKKALADRPQRPRPIPDGIVNVRIDPATGLLARPGQSNALFEYFRAENVPTRTAGQDGRR